MEQNNMIVLNSLIVRPYSSDSFIASHYPAFSSIKFEGDFNYDTSYEGIALVFTAYKDIPNDPMHTDKAIRNNFVAELHEFCDDEVLFSKEFSVTMNPWLEMQDCRIDMPIDGNMLQPDKTYEVLIVRKKTRQTECSAHFTLYHGKTADLIARRPVTEMYLKHFCSNERLISIDLSSELGAQLCFKVKGSIHTFLYYPPKYSVVLYNEDKMIESQITAESTYDNSLDSTLYTCDIPHEALNSGLVCAVVRTIHRPVAAAVFYIGGEDSIPGTLNGDGIYQFPQSPVSVRDKVHDLITSHEKAPIPLEKSLEQINSLTGLKEVKSKLNKYLRLAQFNIMRQKAGLPIIDLPLHAMFLGAPGTGKTTVAKLMGKIMHTMGLLSKGHVIVKDRSTLVGKFYGTEEDNVKNVLEEAKGGILLIDEAYQLLAEDDPRDPGRHVINALMTALSDTANRDLMVIFAGYTDPTLRLFDINPGLQSRIPETNRYHFEDFSLDELQKIAFGYFDSHHFVITDEAKTKLESILKADYKSRDDTFGNARHVVNLIETYILPAMAERVAMLKNPTHDMIRTITPDDMPQRHNIEDEADAILCLDKMVGLKSVKDKVETYINVVRLNEARKAAGMRIFDTPLHSIFTGAPGTGKTTVAKLMGRLLRNAGVLSKGHVIVKERKDLVGRYYGDEEKLTARALKEARGGILFIDEAYQLIKESDPKDPGRNVIEALMTAMADTSYRDLMIIFVGYPDEMERIFSVNAGLKSRIPESNIYTFDDYTAEELMDIAKAYLHDLNLVLDANASEALWMRLKHDHKCKTRSFGNARHVVNLIETSILPAMANRLARYPETNINDISTIKPCDIPMPATQSAHRMRLGFAV